MDEEGENDPGGNSAADAETRKITPSDMMNLLAAGGSGVTRELRHWEPPTAEELQKALPQYEVRAFVARGGMGAVYKGVQKSLGRTVAIKILPPDIVNDEMDYAARFKREAQAMASLSHPNIVAVHEAGETPEGLLYFVMEFVEGTDVSEMIATQRRLPPNEAVRITTAVCAALESAHARGIIHRDIKPSNVLLNEQGEVKVADFGLAKIIDTDGSQTQSSVTVGTPNFVAPEAQTPGIVLDARADIYSVGVMLYEMLTGKVPRGCFDPPSGEVPGIDARLDGIIDKAMQADREKRYASAADLRTVLESVVAPARAWLGAKPHRPAMAAAGVLALAAVVLTGGGALWWKRNIETPTDSNASQAVSKPKQLPNEPSWVPVRLSPGERESGDITVTSEGVLKVHHGFGIPHVLAKNVAFRGRLRRPPDVQHSGLQARTRGIEKIALKFGVSHAWLEEAGYLDPPADAIDLKPNEGVDTPVLLHLAVVGEYAYGWVDGRPLPRFRISGVSETGGVAIWSGNGEFSDLEVMILDGVPEAEALKLSGKPQDVPFTNSLGMKFVPVPGTDVLFCIHETRAGDYVRYVAANPGVEGTRNIESQAAKEHPVMNVNWNNARAFCAWLSQKEGRAYRLPTDREWSHAVGIGGEEAPNSMPESLNAKLLDQYPWGSQWPPPAGAGNLADASFLKTFPGGSIIEGYSDGFPTTAPVMSFAPNKLGIHDLGGNVWEWCEDWWSATQKERVGRGGAYDSNDVIHLLSSYRVHNPPDFRHRLWGFRIVVEKTLAKDAPSVSNAR